MRGLIYVIIFSDHHVDSVRYNPDCGDLRWMPVRGLAQASPIDDDNRDNGRAMMGATMVPTETMTGHNYVSLHVLTCSLTLIIDLPLRTAACADRAHDVSHPQDRARPGLVQRGCSYVYASLAVCRSRPICVQGQQDQLLWCVI